MRSIPTCKQNCDCQFMLEFLHNMDTCFLTLGSTGIDGAEQRM